MELGRQQMEALLVGIEHRGLGAGLYGGQWLPRPRCVTRSIHEQAACPREGGFHW